MTDLFLIRFQTRHSNDVQLSDNFSAAVDTAKLFVGSHNPVDGCSSEPRSFQGPKGFWVARSTSFGERRATVIPVSFDDRNELI